MQLRDIEYVVTVAQEKSFSKAAEKLFISQPALSQSIKRLEQELGVPLFNRNTNSVRLSSAGELFVTDGTNILNMSKHLKKKMSGIQDLEKGHIRLGISSFYSYYHLVKIIPVFRARYPDIKLEITEDISFQLEQHALDGTVDISLVPLPLAHDGLDCRIIHHEQILFALPGNSSLIDKLTPALSSDLPFIDLSLAKDEPFIFLNRKQRFTDMGLQLCKEAGFVPNIIYDSMNWDTVNALIGSGLGVGFVPEIVAERSSGINTSPVYCRIIGLASTRPYAVVSRKGTELSSEAQNFITAAQTVFRQYIRSDSIK